MIHNIEEKNEGMNVHLSLFEKNGSHTTIHIQELERIEAGDMLADLFQIEMSAPIWKIVRLHCIHEEPIELEYLYVPVGILPQLTKQACHADFTHLIEQQNEASFQSAENEITPHMLLKKEKELLETSQALTNKLSSKRYLDNGRTYTYSETIFRDAAFAFTMTKKR
ncbi:UTRA domain-containing protein [Shouchella sp. 1P09AA]|uniref:UTRA domain-containing protein n=1 Tax=unclassified Shouchella TaxID=2893065 RepID=UPI0039A2F8F8